MNRAELIDYINNSILLDTTIKKDSEELKGLRTRWETMDKFIELVGSVCVDGIFYFKKDSENKIHLLFCDSGLLEDKDLEIDLGDSVDIIDSWAFAWKNNIKSVSGERVTKISSCAFYWSWVKELNFPNVEEISSFSLQATEKLARVTFNKIKVIPEGAFAESGIRSFRGDKVEVSEIDAFRGCKQLEKLILPRLCEEAVNELYKYSH